MLHEECGVFGIYTPSEQPLGDYVFAGLTALQHRGQESCGIVVNKNGLFSVHKGLGLVNDVFPPETLAQFGTGSIAIGHARYGTTGGNELYNVQPIVVNHMKGHTAFAHNGNLINALEVRSELEQTGSIFHTTSDTEVISYLDEQDTRRLLAGHHVARETYRAS